MNNTHAFWNVGITGHWFIGAVALLTICLGVGTVLTWEWPRFRIARRMLGIFGTQLMVTATLAAVINSQAGFYSSTGELAAAFGVGVNGTRAPAVTVPTTYVGAIAADQHGPQSWDRHRSGRQHGLIIQTGIRGKTTGYDLPADIYLPSAYFNRNEPTRRFPVVELVDGYPGSPSLWLHALGVVNMLNQLIAEHRIPPMIAVMPTQNPVPGRDSECVNAVAGAQADTYLGVDVPAAISQQFRTMPSRAGWAMLGYSTGGYCAVNTVLHHSARFSAAASLSGYFSALTDITTGDLYHGNTAVRNFNTPLLTVGQKRSQPIRFYLFGSYDDHHEVALDRAFAAKIRRPDQVTQSVFRHGGHNFQTWDRALPSAFEWLGKTLNSGRVAAT